jgi:alkylated DNA repair dioxygenase AlkB
MDGIQVIESFISEEEEKQILDSIVKSPDYKHRGNYRNSIKLFVLSDNKSPIYNICARMLENKLIKSMPKSIIVNEYFPNQTIEYHIDNEKLGSIIAILSLLSDTKLLFKTDLSNEDIEKPMNRRSLIVLEGTARYKWQHSIPILEQKRYSLVFRNCD